MLNALLLALVLAAAQPVGKPQTAFEEPWPRQPVLVAPTVAYTTRAGVTIHNPAGVVELFAPGPYRLPYKYGNIICPVKITSGRGSMNLYDGPPYFSAAAYLWRGYIWPDQTKVSFTVSPGGTFRAQFNQRIVTTTVPTTTTATAPVLSPATVDPIKVEPVKPITSVKATAPVVAKPAPKPVPTYTDQPRTIVIDRFDSADMNLDGVVDSADLSAFYRVRNSIGIDYDGDGAPSTQQDGEAFLADLTKARNQRYCVPKPVRRVKVRR